MINLLRADLRKIIYSKSTIVCLSLAFGFALLNVLMPLLYIKMMNDLIGDLEESVVYTLKELITSTVKIFGDFGIVLPIMASLIIGREFSNGTIRNKILSGNSKGKVFISMTLSTLIYVIAFNLIFFIFVMAIGSIFFRWGVKFDGTEFIYFLQWIMMSLLISFFIACLVTAFTCLVRNVALSIVFILVFGFILSIITMFSFFKDQYPFVGFIMKINPSYQLNELSSGKNFSLEMVLYSLISNLSYGLISFSGGLMIFRKQDIK